MAMLALDVGVMLAGSGCIRFHGYAHIILADDAGSSSNKLRISYTTRANATVTWGRRWI
jgi:hypothetical protein